MSIESGVGLVAGLLTTAAFLPQVLRIWKTKSAGDLSTGTFIVFCVGVLLWLVYGILKSDLAVIVSNLATLVLGLAILALKFRYAYARGHRPPAVDAST